MTDPAAITAPADVLRVQGLSTAYGNRQVLRDVSLQVAKGEIFVIMGESGSGKTTLLRHLIGLNKPQPGSVELLGKSLGTLSKRELFELRKRIGVAFQSGALINSMSVIDNVELPLRQHTSLDPSTIRIMSRMKLDMMSLGNAEDLMPAQLSGGMLKRAGLARAVIMDPHVLFFDEPSAGLDPVTSAELDEPTALPAQPSPNGCLAGVQETARPKPCIAAACIRCANTPRPAEQSPSAAGSCRGYRSSR